MTDYTITEQEFLDVVSHHKMTIIMDNGVYRRIRFKNPASSAYWFELITWPGVLCINGDMGTFVFQRLEDMFEFFRADVRYLKRLGLTLAISPNYWSEKLVAPTSRDVKEFSRELFCQYVKESYADWCENNTDTSESVKAGLWKELESVVICSIEDGEANAYKTARNFVSLYDVDFNLQDCWEWNCRDFKHSFIWCCFAIAWGVATYDRETTEQIG